MGGKCEGKLRDDFNVLSLVEIKMIPSCTYLSTPGGVIHF